MCRRRGVVIPVLCNRPSEPLCVSLSATWTVRLLDQVVFQGGNGTSLLAHWWTRLGRVPRFSVARTHAFTLWHLLLQAITESRASGGGGGGLSLELLCGRNSFSWFSKWVESTPSGTFHSPSLHTWAQSSLVISVEAFLFLSWSDALKCWFLGKFLL